jgi:6-methylsalicylate decarboxylase
MDANNVSKSILSISSPGVFLEYPSENTTKAAIELARRVNDYASGLKAKYPDAIRLLCYTASARRGGRAAGE